MCKRTQFHRSHRAAEGKTRETKPILALGAGAMGLESASAGRTHLLALVNRRGIINVRVHDSDTGPNWENREMTTYKIVLLLTVVMSMGCNSFAAKPTETNLSDNARLAACGNNCFALQLYQKLQGEKGNLFFSPYSISTALAMTYAGARGRTQEQMAQALCFPTSKEVVQKLVEAREPLAPEDFARAFSEIIKDLNARGGKGTYELRVANALWGQQDFEFLSSFAKLVEDQYGGTWSGSTSSKLPRRPGGPSIPGSRNRPMARSKILSARVCSTP